MKKSILLFVLPLLCLMIYPSISGAIGFEGFGGKLALVLPDGGNNTIGFGAIASLGSILPQMTALKTEVGAEYWSNSQGFYSSSAISFNGTAKYYFTNVGMQPFAGAGLGLVSGDNLVHFGHSGIDLGIHLLGGVELPIGTNMKFIAEARYVSANGHWFQISGGVMVNLK